MDFDVIIIGGSYAGLSAALALGRARRNVLVIDAGKPCNRQTPHSHNFLTHDGESPAQISGKAKSDVLKYPTVKMVEATVIKTSKEGNHFSVNLENGIHFHARKLLIATGLKDVLPDIKGLADCWAISVIHCPYCHGYEFRDEKIGLFMNGDHAFEMARTLWNWNKDLTLLTNGKSQLTVEQTERLRSRSISIIEDEIVAFEHENGMLESVVFRDNKRLILKAVYARGEIMQHLDFENQLGLSITNLNTINVDEQQRTNVEGIYAAGDCTTLMRTLSVTAASGTLAGVMINKELTTEDF
ncbi:NAD(P)/FAD-dependent oxidoreductase [Pedobacter frigidisoli]|uniref:NAD(P)/FAD-dependent oxidoreductase n=1 Tax=Pedobacter frigidisoli TaxID=2530455 RepID=UPI00292F8247|nr:NAD(P)/FAD-dependent oxidoreductase [Pedobacter frigidisoli]